MSTANFSPVLRQIGDPVSDMSTAEDSAAGIQALSYCLISYIEKSGDGFRTVSLFDMDELAVNEGDELQSGQSIIYMDKSRIRVFHCF